MLPPDPSHPSLEQIERLMKQARTERSLYIGDCVSAAIRHAGRALLRTLTPLRQAPVGQVARTRLRHRVRPI